MSTSDKKQLSCKDAAMQLGVSGTYIRRLCQKGILKAYKINKDWIIPMQSINTYLKQKNKG